MHNTIIYLSNTENLRRRTKIRKSRKTICSTFVLFADAVATLSIGVCTIFCMYLAYTML